MIGDYFGEDIELNKAALYYHIDTFDFRGTPYIDAMKKMLATFRLPPEGQKVDRIMEKFGEKYCKDNSDVIGSAECVYVLSYATMMLQTSLHNP
jgi:Sec7-like guanine-nucleotide exchange factor